MLSFLGGKKTLTDQLLAGSFKDAAERDGLLKQLRESGLRPPDLLPLIGHSDTGVRQIAAELFLARADERSALLLVEGTADKHPQVRGVALRLFNRHPDDAIRRTLDGLVADKDHNRQRLGWEYALNVSGNLRLIFLERVLKDGPAGLRATALQKLLQDRDPAVMVGQLLEAARSSDPRLNSTAMEALVQVPDPRVLDLMLDRFSTGDAAARDRATLYLRAAAKRDPAGMRKKMLDLLAAGEDATRRQGMEILFETGSINVVLMEVLHFCKDMMGWLRTRILETLRTVGDPVMMAAVELLQHREEEVRTAALVLCENFKDGRLVEPVGQLLAEPDWWLRISACDTLGRLGDERGVPYLVKALEDPDTRWAAIDGLAQLASPQALRPLAGLLRDPRQEVRMEVVRAFSRFSDPRLLPLLQAVKEKDPSTEVRTRAAEVHRDLATRLNQAVGETDRGTSAANFKNLSRPIDRLLAMIRDEGASDLHLTVDEPPMIRVFGQIKRRDDLPVWSADEVREAVLSILEERQRKIFLEYGELDFCHAVPEVGRYRANAFVQRKGTCVTFRVIPNVPPTFADLRIPGQLTELLDYHQGMIVISGPAGCGKSTTLAAIVNLINETKADHVITLEDPIEFVHPVKSALLNQREVGRHTQSFARALRAALREDPDVIVVGEMRDVETVRLAMTAAETGHLVVGTLHTTGAVATVDRLIKSFPPDEQAQVRMALSESLKYVVSQQLIPRRDGKGRVAAFEVLKGTFSIGNLIRDEKVFQIPSMMQIGRRFGMQTRDMALTDLVEAGLVAPETAWARADKPANFEALCDPAFIREKNAANQAT